MSSFINALTQARVVPVAPAISQARWGASTPITRTLVQVEVVVQMLRAFPVTGEQPIMVARHVVEPAMTDEEQKKLELFQKLHRPYFDVTIQMMLRTFQVDGIR